MEQSQYAQKSDLIALAVTPDLATQLSDEAIEAHLKAASSDCDNYLHSQFYLPLQDWDMGLTKATCYIAAASLLEQYGFNPNAPQDQVIFKRRDEAFKYLRDIAEELIFPIFVDSSNAVPKAGPYVISNSPVGFATFNNGRRISTNGD